jgi:23S rRNA (cytidine1920-2'-O)/16S rRNA (cytidine1409-2'-O)-methyltransferase
MKVRLDQLLVTRGLVSTRSQAESYIRLGKVSIGERPAKTVIPVSRSPGHDPGEAEESSQKILRQAQDDTVNWRVITKPGFFVSADAEIDLAAEEQFVSRAALKLKSVAEKLNLNFKDKIVLDVGSSTGGFTEFALSRGAKKVIAVDVGTDQLHPKLRKDPRIELHEKTDIRDFFLDRKGETGNSTNLSHGHRTGVGLSLQATARSSSPRPLPMAQPS